MTENDEALVLYGELQALLNASPAPAVEKALTVLMLGADVYCRLDSSDAADFRAALDDIIKRL